MKRDNGFDSFEKLSEKLDDSLLDQELLQKDLLRIRSYCIRKKYDEAISICNQIIEKDPLCIQAYVGIIKARSKNYSDFEYPNIDDDLDALRIMIGDDYLNCDKALTDYLMKRRINEETKAKTAEAQRKAEETEALRKAELRTKAIAVLKVKLETEQKRKDTEHERIKKIEENGTCVVKNGILVHFLRIGKNGHLTIPNGVTEIGENAFYCCRSLKSITIPNSVITIGKKAFWECTNLTSVVIPNGVTIIGYSAFERCTGLTSVTIANSVTNIEPVAFYGCDNLSTIYYDGTESEWNRIIRRGIYRDYNVIFMK